MNILKLVGVLVLQIFLRYLGVFLAFGLIYISIIRDIDPHYWALVGYPLVFLAMWTVVYFAVKDGVKKISPNEASIWKISFVAAVISVFLWLLVRFPGVTLLSHIMNWIVPVDLSGFNFLIPSSIVQLSLLAGHINLLWLFPLQFVGAILFLAALIAKTLSEKTDVGKVSRRAAIMLLVAGGIIMAVVQAIYIYYYFTTVPNFYNSQDQIQTSNYNKQDGWQTFWNDFYSIKIPNGWNQELSNYGAESDYHVAGYVYGSRANLNCEKLFLADCEPGVKSNINLAIYVYDNPERLSAGEYIKKNYGRDYPPSQFPLSLDNSIVDYETIPIVENRGEGIEEIGYLAGKKTSERYYFSNKKYFYDIRIVTNIPKTDLEAMGLAAYEKLLLEYKPAIGQIINSFYPAAVD